MSFLISNATIHDGSGAEPTRADVLIEGATITTVAPAIDPGDAATDGGETAGVEVIDGTGLALAPGFIDAHTHDDFAALVHPDMAFKNRGGVTTCIVGNCGFGAAPLEAARGFAASMHPGHDLPDYDGYGGYISHLDSNPPGVNIGVLAGHGTIRWGAIGAPATRPDHEPSPDEMAAMKALLAEALDAGVLGMSTGLVYEPGRHANTEELIELAATMAGTGALYATHMRDEGPDLLDSVAEAIRIGAEAGVPVQISHHKATGPDNWGRVVDSLALIDQARADGVAVNVDQYPYTAGSTTLESVLTNYVIAETADGGTLPPDRLVVASCEAEPGWEGRSMAELAAEFGCEPGEAARRVVEAARTTTCIMHVMDENDIRTVMTHPATVIGSDGLPTIDARPHPRLYNTFARVLGHYSRELGLMPLADAIARMTGRTADIFGLTDRGYVRPGYAADLVLFDADSIIDRGTFADPNQYPDGIAWVWVNGQPVVAGGEPTGARPGQVLRRARS